MRKFRQGKIKILIATEAAGRLSSGSIRGVICHLLIFVSWALISPTLSKSIFLKKKWRRRKGADETEAAVDSDGGSEDAVEDDGVRDEA